MSYCTNWNPCCQPPLMYFNYLIGFIALNDSNYINKPNIYIESLYDPIAINASTLGNFGVDGDCHIAACIAKWKKIKIILFDKYMVLFVR